MLHSPGVVGFCTLGVGVHWHLVHLHSAMSYCSGVIGVCTLGLDLGGHLVLGMSAFCNTILSWCSRALYTWTLFRGWGWGVNWH